MKLQTCNITYITFVYILYLESIIAFHAVAGLPELGINKILISPWKWYSENVLEGCSSIVLLIA